MTAICSNSEQKSGISLLAEQLECIHFPLKENNVQVDPNDERLPEIIPRMTTFPRPVLRKPCNNNFVSKENDDVRELCVQTFTLDDWGPAAFAKLVAQHKEIEANGTDSPGSSCDSVESLSHYSTASGFSSTAESPFTDEREPEASPTISHTSSTPSDMSSQGRARCRTVSFSDHNVTVATFPSAEYDRSAVDPSVLSFQERVEFLVWREKMLKEIAQETGYECPEKSTKHTTESSTCSQEYSRGSEIPVTSYVSPFPHDRKSKDSTLVEASNGSCVDPYSSSPTLPTDPPSLYSLAGMSSTYNDPTRDSKEPTAFSTSVFHAPGVTQFLF